MVYRKKTSSRNYKRKINPFRKRNTRGMIARQKRGQLVKLIKDTQIAESEMKYKSATRTVPSLYHNSVNETHLWGPSSAVSMYTMPSQGTNDGARIGDRIYLKGIQLRGLFQIPGDRLNTSVAIYYVPHNSEQGSPGTYSDLFHNITGSAMMDTLQKKRFPGCKFLGRFSSKPHDMWQHGGGTNVPWNSGSIYVNRFININKKIYFKADASDQPSNLKEYGTIVVVPYQNVNTLATDIVVVNCDLHATAYFKDI